MVTAMLAIGILSALFGLLLGYAAIRFRVEGDPVVDQVDALLPQTQCAQCGYPGCRPYAQAIVDGVEADEDDVGVTAGSLGRLDGVVPTGLSAPFKNTPDHHRRHRQRGYQGDSLLQGWPGSHYEGGVHLLSGRAPLEQRRPVALSLPVRLSRA